MFSVRFLQLQIVHFSSKNHLKSHPSLKILKNQCNLCEVIPDPTTECELSFWHDSSILYSVGPVPLKRNLFQKPTSSCALYLCVLLSTKYLPLGIPQVSRSWYSQDWNPNSLTSLCLLHRPSSQWKLPCTYLLKSEIWVSSMTPFSPSVVTCHHLILLHLWLDCFSKLIFCLHFYCNFPSPGDHHWPSRLLWEPSF